MARKQPEQGFVFTRDMIEASDRVPAMLSDYRLKSWQSYQEQSFPSSKDEAWRRTSLSGLDFTGLKLPNGKTLEGMPEKATGEVLTDTIIGENTKAVLFPTGVEIKLSAESKKAGLIIESLLDAAEGHPELLSKVLGKVILPSDGKFAAAAAAFATQGLFIYVPKGIQLNDPIFSISHAPWQNTAHFYQILVYLEEGSSLTYFHESISPDGDSEPSLAAENIEIFVGQNANLKFIELQSFGKKVWSFGHQKAIIERDGYLEWDISALGSFLTKHFISVDLVGNGAEGRVTGLFFANQDQHLTYNTLQRHMAPRTTSDLLFKGALNGNSRSVWRGMIYVAPGARHIDGYQANRNLVLDQNSRADSIPGLEILNNDVRCTHGSTVGKIDQEQLFYLLSRGIPREQAEQLIIQGFFDEIFSRYDQPIIKDRLWQLIQKKLNVKK